MRFVGKAIGLKEGFPKKLSEIFLGFPQDFLAYLKAEEIARYIETDRRVKGMTVYDVFEIKRGTEVYVPRN